jgi:cytochrome c2
MQPPRTPLWRTGINAGLGLAAGLVLGTAAPHGASAAPPEENKAVAVVSAPTQEAAKAGPLKAEDIIRTHSCAGCHVIPGVPEAQGRIGPPLAGLSERRRIAGDKLKNTPENLRLWLRNPKAIKTTLMPNTGLTEAELDVLVAFLQKL